MSQRTAKASPVTAKNPVMPTKEPPRPNDFEREYRESRVPCVPHGGITLEEAIRARAYQLWDHAGRPEGDGVSFWLEAEQQLKEKHS